MAQLFNTQSCIEHLEARRLLSTTTETLAIGNVLYTAVDSDGYSAGSDLYRSNLDGSSQTLLQHWQSGPQGPANLYALGNKLIFAADYAEQDLSGRELWASDGTAAGTKLIADFYERAAGSNPHDFHTVNGRAVFVASNNSPRNFQLYTTDGTAAGTAMISPSLQDTYYSAVTNVSYTSTSVTWDYYQNRLEMNQRLSSNGQLNAGGAANWSVLYTEPNDGVVRISPNSDTVARSLAASQDNAGNTFLIYNDETLRFRTADVQSMFLGDTFGDDTISVDSSVGVPVTVSSSAGDDTIGGGGMLTTLDLSTHRGMWNADNTVYTSNEVVTLNDSGGLATFDDGSKMIINGGIGTVIGGYGDDQITGTSRSETLLGGHGDDTIIGNGGGDSIDGGDGADHITASRSRDTLVADSADTVTDSDINGVGGGGSGGGTGVGTVSRPAWTYANGVVRIYGTSGDDDIRLVPSASSLKLILNGVMSKVLASKVSTVVVDAKAGDDFVWLRNMAVNSYIYGDAGNDAITTSNGKDRIYGGDGNDSIEGGGNHDTIYGEAGDDRVAGGEASDYVSGGGGTNVIRGEGGVDHIVYTNLDDVHGNRGDKMDIDSLIG